MLRRSGSSHSKPRTSLITLFAVAVVLLVLVAGVVVYDQAHRNTIAEGVTIGGADVGGQTVAQARATLQRDIVEPLGRPIVVKAADRTFRLSAKEAKTTLDIDATLAQALERSREGHPAVRTWRAVTGARVRAEVAPQVDYSRDAVSRLIDRVRVAVTVKARDAKVDFAATNVTVQSARTGRAINTQNLRDAVTLVLADPSLPREVKATWRTVKPKVGDAQLAKRYPVILTVDRANFRLNVFKDLKLDTTYPIALGHAGQETPSGAYQVANKAVNPSWHVPDSDWAGERAGTVVPPGPSNPIKARWLGIYDGVGIHGTDDRSSIGSFASKGCIRMLVEDVIDLYPRVPVGAPIYIS